MFARLAVGMCAAALVCAAALLPPTGRLDAASDDGSVSISQRADTVVKLAAAPRHRGGGTLVPELTVGEGESSEEYDFTSVTDILPARDGTLWILDGPGRATPVLRQFSAAGKFVRRVGRSGQGPGEFRGPMGIGQLPDGRVVVRDPVSNRVLVYSESGEPVATWTLASRYGWGGRSRDPLLVDTAGVIYLPFSIPRTAEGRLAETRLVRLGVDGSIVDTISNPGLPDPSLPQVIITETVPGGRSSYLFEVPYSPAAFWSPSPLGYLVTGLTNRYALDLRIPRPGSSTSQWRPGDPVVSIRRNTTPVPVTAEERNDQKAYIESIMEGRSGTRTGTLPDVPRMKPYIKSVTFGLDGRLWVSVSMPSEKFTPERAESSRPTTPARTWREPTAYDVFEPDGAYLGRVVHPYDTQLLAKRGDSAWGVVTDADGVPTVKRFRVVWR